MSPRALLTRVLCLLSLVVLGLSVWWTTTGYDFVNWDDPSYVQHNELIRSWSPSHLYGIATETVTRNYAPLTIFSYLVDHTLWGLEPGGYHATNVVLHLLNGCLVLLLLQQLTGSRFVAWLTAALFLVHPVQIESVAWVSSRKGLLCATFMLGACLVRLRETVEPRHDGGYIGLLTAALLSKALAVVLPPIVLLYDVLVRRMRFADAVVRQVIPGFLSVLLLLHTIGAQNSVLGGVRGHMDLPLWHILAVDVTILWQYIGMLIAPTGLCVLYDPPVTGIATWVAVGTVAWLVVAAAAWRTRSSAPLAAFGLAVFFILLAPVLNFVRITTLMNDRYLYLPCLPMFAGAAWLVQRGGLLLTARRPAFRAAARWMPGVLAGAAVGACVVATTNHLPVWRNSFALWEHARAEQPDIPVVRIQMAYTLHDSGQVRDAVTVMSEALAETEPDEADRRRMRQAIEEWQQELQEIRTVSAAGGAASR